MFEHQGQTNASESSKMDPSHSIPSNADIMDLLKNMNNKITHMDQKLNKLDVLEEKVNKMESELVKVWNYVQDSNISNSETMNKITDKVDNFELLLAQANSQILQLQNEKVSMNNTLNYVQSQSMRNNLVFSGVKEDVNEKPEET